MAKSFGSKYVEFETAGSPVKLALCSRRAAAKDAGCSPDGTGSHRIDETKHLVEVTAVRHRADAYRS